MPRPKVLLDNTTAVKRPRGRPPTTVVAFPASLWADWEEPETFPEALTLHMQRHGDTTWSLFRAVRQAGGVADRTTLGAWRRGVKSPGTPERLKVLEILEARYRLPCGYFKDKRPPGRAIGGHQVKSAGPAERRRLAWHLPDDFNTRPAAEQARILEWVRNNVLSGGTVYHRYQSEMSRHRFAIRFEGTKRARTPKLDGQPRATSALTAPTPALADEMRALLRFKTAVLTEVGFQRSGVWGSETASQKVEHLGLMLGTLTASPEGEVRGLGVPSADLSLALLISPAVWDWYVQWREARRGFYTGWEAEMLLFAAALTRRETGWLRQSPDLAARLAPIPALLPPEAVVQIQADWDVACDDLHRHALSRAKEVQRVARVHRDPFEPLISVLEAASPVGEYRKIADEILRRLPDERRSPRAFAEAVRSFLIIRLGLHLGLRQKNMRELLFRARGEPITPEPELERLKRGELRWSERDAGWEVFIPCAAFKNAHSVYFSKRPFRLVLPDLGDLYRWIDGYIGRYRAALLAGARDPGTFFVKTVKRTSSDATYNQNTYYEAWRITIQRYGIYNPFTERGAIKGLLPHGPHSVRDVLATHVLKQTGSYEQASYAIQDTPATVADHYGRFLPQDKAALAAQVLNRVWMDP